MTAPSVFPASLQWVGYALETTPGTPAATPTTFVAVDSPTYKPTYELLTDTNLRGSMAAEYEQITGQVYGTVTFKANWYLDSIYPLFRQILGIPDVITGASDPYTHKTSLQNTGNNGQPAGTTVFWYDGAGKTYQMAGSIMSDLKVTLKTGALAVVEVTYMGFQAVAITPPTLSQSAFLPAPSWNTQVTLAGVGTSVYEEIDLEIKRDTTAIPTISGSQNPVAIFGGQVSVSGSLTALYQGYATDTSVQNQIANTQPVLTVKVSPVGDAVHSVTLQLSQVAYDDVAVTGTTKQMEVKATIKGLANPTDVASGGNQSPILVSMLSPVSTAL